MVERDDARDDRPLMQVQAKAVAELQPESRQFIWEPKLLCLRPGTRNLVGHHSGTDQLDGAIEPFTSLFISVVLRGRGAADIEGAVVAGSITHEALQNVEEGLIAGPDQPVGEIMRMRIAAFTRYSIHRLNVIGAVPVEEFIDLGDDVVFAHARLELFVDHVIGAVDHGRGTIKERDLVGRLEFAWLQPDLLAIDDLHAGFLQFEHHCRLDISTPTGSFSTPAFFSRPKISLACLAMRPKEGCTVPRKPKRPALQFSGLSHGA